MRCFGVPAAWVVTSVLTVLLIVKCEAYDGGDADCVERTPPPPPSSKPELYFLLMNQQINSVYNVTAADAVLARAAAAG